MAQQKQKDVVALVGAGGIGIAIARRVAQGKHLVAFLMGPEATFITGTDILCDGGSTAAYWYGDLQYLQEGWAQS